MKGFASILVPAIALATAPAWAQQSDTGAGQGQVPQQQQQNAEQGQQDMTTEQPTEQAEQAPEQPMPSQQAEEGQEPSDLAQEAPAEGATPAAPEEAIIVMQEESQTRVDTIIGTNVRSGAGEEAETIGRISDLLLDENNNLIAALVGVGGFLGIGEKTVALSWDALSIQRTEGEVSITSEVTREQLDQAPAFRTIQDQLAEQQQEEERQQMEMQQQQSPMTTQ